MIHSIILGLSSKTPDLLRRTGVSLENEPSLYEHCPSSHSQSVCPVLQLHQRARRAFYPCNSQVFFPFYIKKVCIFWNRYNLRYRLLQVIGYSICYEVILFTYRIPLMAVTTCCVRKCTNITIPGWITAAPTGTPDLLQPSHSQKPMRILCESDPSSVVKCCLSIKSVSNRYYYASANKILPNLSFILFIFLYLFYIKYFVITSSIFFF